MRCGIASVWDENGTAIAQLTLQNRGSIAGVTATSCSSRPTIAARLTSCSAGLRFTPSV